MSVYGVRCILEVKKCSKQSTYILFLPGGRKIVIRNFVFGLFAPLFSSLIFPFSSFAYDHDGRLCFVTFGSEDVALALR